MQSCINGNIEITQLLIDKGAEISIDDIEKWEEVFNIT